MKSVIQRKSISIFVKITILNIAIVILISLISTVAMLNHFSSNMIKKDQLLLEEASSKIATFMQDKYNMIYNQRTLIHSTGFISDIIVSTRNHPADIYKLENVTKITDYLNALSYSDEHICDAVLFTADGKNTFSASAVIGRSVYLNYDFNSLPYIRDFYDSDHTITAVYDPAPPYLTVASETIPAKTITFMAKIYDMDQPAKKILVGYLMINFSPESIDGTYSQIKSASSGEYYVINPDSQVVYSNIPSALSKSYGILDIKTEDIIFDKTLSLSGIRVIGTISYNTLKKNLNEIIYRCILITLTGILIMVTGITFSHRIYARRFAHLANAMGQISQGDFQIRLPVTSQDEIGFLSQTINSMCITLDEYIKKNYLAETQRKTAELYALQAQINPHFLANTIESIRMKAMEDDCYDVSEMLSKLGNLFRWMIQFHQDIVYLEDEMEYIESYLDLQRFRFGERIAVDIDIPSDAFFLGIPKFTLQPIVENAITHGTFTSSAPLSISIQFLIQKDTFIITVSDNGQGMSEETLDHLQHHINGTKNYPQFGVALRNVNTRIKLLFGDTYGLNIKSTHCLGTTITVTLPAERKEELENYVQNDHCRR